MNTQQLLLLLGLSVLIYNCSNSTAADSPTPSARQVQTATAETIEYRDAVVGSGLLSSKEEVRLSFKTGGIIYKIYVNEGQSVRKNQLLAELELEEIRAETQKAGLGEEKARIDLENAKLALQLAERDYKNVQGLYKDSVATLEQLENVEVQLDNARNQLEAAKTAVEFSTQNTKVADFNLKYSKILAPSEGTILRKYAETNEMVGSGTPVFLFGSREKAQVLKVNVADKDIIHIQLGDPAEVRFDAYPGVVFKGKVRELAGTADPMTGTYEVEIEVDPAGKKLLSGFIGAVSIQTESAHQLVRIPAGALLTGKGKTAVVYIIENGRAVQRTIHIYKMEGEDLLIQEGITNGDTVITSGAGYLEEGQAVLVIE